jgi:hypothetical protein
MQQVQVPRGTRRTATVQEDWIAWLPQEKDTLFDATLDELEVSYVVLSVALNDAFTLCQNGKFGQAREEVGMFVGLFDRLAGRVRGVLRTLNEHGRHFGTKVSVMPLCPDFFRSEHAQQLARANNLAFLLVLRSRTRFLRKLGAIDETVAALRNEAQDIAGGVTNGSSIALPNQWTRLEVLHYDLNTCLRETTVVLKSFLCVLPSEELNPFRKRLLSFLPVALPIRPAGVPLLPRRTPAGGSWQAKRQALAAASPSAPGSARRRRRRGAHSTSKDNLRSTDRIPLFRMRPDGTGGPNETN